MILAAALLLQAAAPAASASSQAADKDCPSGSVVSREFEGIWLDQFEGQQFFENIRKPSDLPALGSAPWLSIDRSATLSQMLAPEIARIRTADMYVPRLYRLRFIGYAEPVYDCRPTGERPPIPGCIGKGGSFPGRIIVEHVVFLQDLGPLPAGGQPVARQLR